MKKFFLTLFFLFKSIFIEAIGYEVRGIKLNCPIRVNCNFLEKRIELAIKSSSSVVDFNKNLKFMIYDPLISSFSFRYELIKGGVDFTAQAKLNLLVSKIQINGTGINLKTHLGKNGLREGKEFSKESAFFSIKELKNQLEREGYFSSKVWFKKQTINGKLYVNFYVNPGEPTTIERVEVPLSFPSIASKFKKLEGKNWSLSKVNLYKQESMRELSDLGFFNGTISESIVFENKNERKAVLRLKISPGVRKVFHLEGNEIVEREKLLEHIKKSVSRLGESVSSNQISSIILSFYKKNGILESEITTSLHEGIDRNHQSLISFNIIINEGDYKRIHGFEIKNSSPETIRLLENILAEIKKPYFDSGKYNKIEMDFIQSSIVEKLKKLGFLDPQVAYEITNSTGREKVAFDLNLGDRFLVGLIDLGFEIRDIKHKVPLVLKRGDIFSESIVDEERKNLIRFLKNKGYFFAKYASSKPFIRENNLTKKVDLDFQINPGLLSELNEIRIEGLGKTKKRVITREIEARKGDILTPELVQNLNDQLVSLSIFSFLSISPVVVSVLNEKNLVDLVINVREKDFGVLTVSPGFRTDIGPKIDINIQKNNISGDNKNLLFGGRVSKRTDLTLLDPERRNFSDAFFEYRLNSSYSIPYFFKSFNRSVLSSELTRRRFFGFDADIVRASVSLDKKVSKKGSLFFRYQFELIEQFNATEELENGEFRIGGVTASYFYDNRNRVINPSSGNYHSFSAELAHPFFLSMDDDLEINFLKLQSRNRFYYRLNSLIFASSFAAGWQKNLGGGDSVGQKLSYIPRVKVFRLEGIDNVRGYNSNEVNRVFGGEDISEFVIDDEASFFNLKAEIRREVSPSIMLSSFYDLGKVMPANFNFNNLKHSLGLSLKLLTPVGTLNLDYGLKLNREIVNGEKEQFGRFHLMVGYF